MRIVAVSALLSTIALPVMAQRAVAPVRDSAPPAAACDSVLRAAAVDSLQTVVTAYLARTDGGLVPREYADLLLQDFGQRFRVPQPLRVPVLAPGPDGWAAAVGPGDGSYRRHGPAEEMMWQALGLARSPLPPPSGEDAHG